MPDDDDATAYHAPVLVQQVLDWLNVGDGTRFADGTAGGGGHSEAILRATSPEGRLLAVDRDPDAVEQVRRRLAKFGDRVTVVRANYSETPELLEQLGWPRVDGWLIDAGVSSHQLDEPTRGFSFRHTGPLDMRMGPEAPTVAEFLDTTDADELADVLYEFGEISASRRLAADLLDARRSGDLETTTDLADLVADHPATPPEWKRRTHPATLVFQALRIAVNQELEHLRGAVRSVPRVVADEGRAVFISFHSLEDRIVKHEFRRLADPCVCPADLPVCGCDAESFGRVLTSGPVTPTPEEIDENPRARSARLRVFEVRGTGRWPNQ